MAHKINCSLKKNKNNSKCKKAKKIYGEGEFSMVLPKYDNSGKPIKAKKIQSYIKGVNDIFGGSTTIPVTKGCYTEGDKFFCEEGLKIIGSRDFDGKYSKSKFKKMTKLQRKKQLEKDYGKLIKLAKQSSKDFGQDSIMITYDEVKDVSFVGNDYKKRLPKKLIGKKKIFNYREF